MKPNFALTLSFDGISLLMRAFPGWQLVGEVALDSADLAGDLTALREKAENLGKGDLNCKLVLPNDQIKFLSLESGADVESALDGATPYALSDLAPQWTRAFGGTRGDRADDFVVTPTGDLVLLGDYRDRLLFADDGFSDTVTAANGETLIYQIDAQ